MRPSTKPCHGCGQTGQYRAANELCKDCALLLQNAREELRIAARNILSGKEEAVLAAIAPHHQPYIPHTSWMRGGDTEDPGTAFQVAIQGLVYHLSKPLGDEWGSFPEGVKPVCLFEHRNKQRSSYGGFCVRSMDATTAAFLRSIYDAVLDIADAAHTEGHKRGRDLLGALARNEITAKEFNEAATREDGP